MEYSEDEYLLLSGIQHFSFCRRQWALIHIEQQWQENLKTVEGSIVHEHCHDENFFEKRGNLLITRGLRICSNSLGVTGQCDVVEFRKSKDGCILHGQKDLWQPLPVEYKRGKSKKNDADRLQLCGQGMCLEEMLGTTIDKGVLFYAEIHRREEVLFTEYLRTTVKNMLEEMHDYYRRGYTPKVKPHQGCYFCSLKDLCLPVICRDKSVQGYYDIFLKEDC